MLRTVLVKLLKLLLWLVLASILVVLLFRWVPVPGTALMVERKIESWGQGESLSLQHQWRSWDEIADDLKLAVIAGEDQKFPQHWGFDVAAIRDALRHNQSGGNLRGASTLTQQVAKNLFLWSGRSWPRKALEAWFTGLIELFWPKQRILEVYLNSVEWGDGVFGAEAAAQHHFGVSAAQLSATQASQLAAVLPNPRRWSAGQPDGYVLNRSSWIRQQMRQLGGVSYLQKLDAHE